MSWLIGSSEVDLSPAERAIHQLMEDKDAIAKKLKELQEQSTKQQQRLKELQQAIEKAKADEQRAKDVLESADGLAADKDQELQAINQRLASACGIFKLQAEGERITAALARAKAAVFPVPLVIAGPTAVGKATLSDMLAEEFPQDLAHPLCHTSRAPMEGEEGGVHFAFSSRSEMEQMMKDNKFVEVSDVDGDLYGTTHDAVAAIVEQGKMCVLLLDLEAVGQLRRAGWPCLAVWVAPPSPAALADRLRRRGVDSPEELALRLRQAEDEMRGAEARGGELFDYALVNDDLDAAKDALKLILEDYPHMRGRAAPPPPPPGTAATPAALRRLRRAALPTAACVSGPLSSAAGPASAAAAAAPPPALVGGPAGVDLMQLRVEDALRDPAIAARLLHLLQRHHAATAAPAARA